MLNKKYQTQSTNLVNYDYVDIADGTGTVKLYGLTYKNTTTVYPMLSRYALRPASIVTTGSAVNSASPVKSIDLDFDLSPFNSARTIKGKFFISCAVGAGNPSSGTGAGTTVYVIAKLKKGTEEIASVQSGTTASLGSGTQDVDWTTLSFQGEVTTFNSFKVGETLRITLEVWGTHSGATDSLCYLAHDPLDRFDDVPIGAGVGTKPDTAILELHIPFRIDT